MEHIYWRCHLGSLGCPTGRQTSDIPRVACYSLWPNPSAGATAVERHPDKRHEKSVPIKTHKLPTNTGRNPHFRFGEKADDLPDRGDGMKRNAPLVGLDEFWAQFSLDVEGPACNLSGGIFAKVVPRLKMHLEWVKHRCFDVFFVGPEKCVRPILCRDLVAFLPSSA